MAATTIPPTIFFTVWDTVVPVAVFVFAQPAQPQFSAAGSVSTPVLQRQVVGQEQPSPHVPTAQAQLIEVNRLRKIKRKIVSWADNHHIPFPIQNFPDTFLFQQHTLFITSERQVLRIGKRPLSCSDWVLIFEQSFRFVLLKIRNWTYSKSLVNL